MYLREIILSLIMIYTYHSESIQLVSSISNKSYEIYSILHAKHQSQISSLVEGKIIKRNFSIGDQVLKSQVLYILDSYPQSHQLKSHKIELEKLFNQLKYLKLKLSRRLKNEDAYTEERVEEVKLQVDNVLFLIKKVKNQVSLIKETLNKKIIKAPYDGIILDYYKDLGGFTNIGTTLLSMYSNKDYFIRVLANRHLVKQLKLNKKVKIDMIGQKIESNIIRIHANEDKNHMQMIDIAMPFYKSLVLNQVFKVTFEINETIIKIPKKFIKYLHGVYTVKVKNKDIYSLKEIQGDFIFDKFISYDLSFKSLKLESF